MRKSILVITAALATMMTSGLAFGVEYMVCERGVPPNDTVLLCDGHKEGESTTLRELTKNGWKVNHMSSVNALSSIYIYFLMIKQ
ncbi:MAG: hypothetical protein HOP25_02020 [Methylotenera sp.]|nr:hypothetical protein [Methylotenera sp.]